MKILSLGDIHGRDNWKFITHGSSYEYNTWRIAVDNGADPNDRDFWNDLPYSKFDKIIFIGDYTDSFTLSNAIIKSNLLDIIHFKNVMGDSVVLLLGNHDIQYIVSNQICSGFRSEAWFDLNLIFRENNHMFTMAHEETVDEVKWLWTHAGVTGKWYNEVIKDMLQIKNHLAKVYIDFDPINKSVSDVINFAWETRMDNMYNVDSSSGGFSMWASSLWVRPGILNNYAIQGYNQVVGHTPQSDIVIVDKDGDKIHYIDCLEFTDNALEI